MPICNHCGRPLDRPMARCPFCGANVLYTLNGQPFEAPAAPQPEPPAVSDGPRTDAGEPPREPAGPRYTRQETPSAGNSPELTTLQYLLLLILFAIPVVGLIAMLLLALTARRTACRRFATAMLIFRLGGIVLVSVILVLAAFFLFHTGFGALSILPYAPPWSDHYYYNDWGFPYSEDPEPEIHPTAAKDIYNQAFFAATGCELPEGF